MFDTINDLVEQKPNRPILWTVWKELIEYLVRLDATANVLAYYHTESDSYTNIGLLTTRLIIDLEANEESRLHSTGIRELKTLGAISLSNLREDIPTPSSLVARGTNRNLTLAGNLLTREGDAIYSWYAIPEEEEELRTFMRTISTALFSQ